MEQDKKLKNFIKTTIREFLNESIKSNEKAINYFNSLPTINKYSEVEDSVTEPSIIKLANEVSGHGKIVKNIRAKVKSYDTGISWKAYNIETNNVEYYKLQTKHIIGKGGRIIATKNVYKFDNEYTDGVSTLAEPIESYTSGWKDYDTEKTQIEGWKDFLKSFSHKW
jgi:hypothetical protein